MSNNPLAERESRAVGSVFNHATRIIVGEYERDEENRSVGSLYLRDPVTRRAERLPAPDDRTSYRSPVVARSSPFVFFNVMSINDRGGGNWVHVARADLRTRDIEVVFTPDDLFARAAVDRAWRISPWVRKLLSVSDDGLTLTCNIGVPEPRPDGSYHMSYSLFDLDVTTRALVRLLDLDSPYG
jgi:hypothetical protein